MKNVFFPDEEITKDDVFYVCSLVDRIPSEQDMGKVYMRLVLSTYEPSYYLTRCYYTGTFN